VQGYVSINFDGIRGVSLQPIAQAVSFRLDLGL
jgi:hypothetical protein